MQSLKYFLKVTANKIIREIKRNLKNCPAGGGGRNSPATPEEHRGKEQGEMGQIENK